MYIVMMYNHALLNVCTCTLLSANQCAIKFLTLNTRLGHYLMIVGFSSENSKFGVHISILALQ